MIIAGDCLLFCTFVCWAHEGWVAPVKRGKVMFEIAGVSEEIAREALRLASHKLPVKTKFVKREAE